MLPRHFVKEISQHTNGLPDYDSGTASTDGKLIPVPEKTPFRHLVASRAAPYFHKGGMYPFLIQAPQSQQSAHPRHLQYKTE